MPGFRMFLMVLVAVATGACGQGASDDAGAVEESAEWPPLTRDGQPNIEGLWASGTGISSLNLEPREYLRSIGMPERGGTGGRTAQAEESAAPPRQSDRMRWVELLDPPDQILPYQPWAKERRDAIMRDYLHPTPAQMDPQTRGWPNGVPRANYYTSHDGSVGGPIQTLQPPGYVVFLYEAHHEFRVVPLDGRPHIGSDITLWMGDSRGHWERNTLVIDATNHNETTRFDVVGDFHSDEMRVTERWTFADPDTLEYTATIDDPNVYTRPWTIGTSYSRSFPENELMEYAAVEGDRAVEQAEAILLAHTADEQQD